MNDFGSLEKTIVRELSCRLCLCTDVVKLKPLSAEIKRKLKKLFDIVVRADDNLPKAICHDCLQQIGTLHLYAVKVEKTQKFLDFYKTKSIEDKKELQENKMNPIIADLSTETVKTESNKQRTPEQQPPAKMVAPPKENLEHQGDTEKQIIKQTKPQSRKKNDKQFMEAMSLEEFVKTEKLDKNMVNMASKALQLKYGVVVPENKPIKREPVKPEQSEYPEILDPVVLVDGRPAKQGQALDKQITLFYKMECCICHESGFHFRSLMKHYKDRHGVPGYVTCCDKKFHYFYPKKIIEHMAFHLQPHIFMCPSCHQNFQTSQELNEHQANGGRSEGKILCPRCNERYPTYHELGFHIVTHRVDKSSQCDYCGKQLKHHHRKKTINHMENVILCSQCIRTLRNIEKQEKDIKERIKANSNDTLSNQSKLQKFGQAMGISDEEASTD